MVNNDIIPGFDDEQNENLSIQLHNTAGVEGCLVLALGGYIDTYNANYFLRRVRQAVEAGFIRLIFNCGGLNAVSSTGIGSFTAILKAVKSRGGDVILFAIQPKVHEAFQSLGFSPSFRFQDSLDESIDFFRGNNERESAMFPQIFPCPLCSKKLKAVTSGRFRCPDCKTILAVNTAGIISVG